MALFVDRFKSFIKLVIENQDDAIFSRFIVKCLNSNTEVKLCYLTASLF